MSVEANGHMIGRDSDNEKVWRSYEVFDADGGGSVLRTVALDPLGAYAYVGGETGTIAQLDLARGKFEELKIQPQETIFGLAASSDPRRISYIDGETAFVVCDPTTGEKLATAEVYDGETLEGGNVNETASSPEGSLTAVTSSNLVPGDDPGSTAKSAEHCRLTVFDQKGRKRLNWQFDDYAEFSYAEIAFLDDRTLVAALPSGRLNVWKLQSDAPNETNWASHSIEIPARRHTAAARAFDGRHLWLAHDRKVAKVDADTGKVVALGDASIGSKVGDRAAEPIEALAPTHDPHTVVVACWDGKVQMVKCVPIK